MEFDMLIDNDLWGKLNSLLIRKRKKLAEFTDKKNYELTNIEAQEIISQLEQCLDKHQCGRYGVADMCALSEYPQSILNEEGIYFIQQEPFGANGGAIKIGITGCVGQRLVSLQTANPNKLAIVAIIPHGKKNRKFAETELHLRFRDLCIFNEWFEAKEPLISYIQTLEGFIGWGKRRTGAIDFALYWYKKEV